MGFEYRNVRTLTRNKKALWIKGFKRVFSCSAYFSATSPAIRYSLLRRAIFSIEMPLGQTASQAPVLVHAPNPSLSIWATILSARLCLSGLPCGRSDRWVTLAERKSDYDTGQYSANPPFQPAQWGIAYRRGGKPDHYKERFAPTSGNSFHLNDKVKGLDCGGFIQLIFNTALVTQLSEFQASEFPQKFNSALPSSVYNGLELVNKGHLSSYQMEVGDIVVWNEHIGIIQIQFTSIPQVPVILYNSHGTGYPVDLQDQRKNQGKNRGVHALTWFQADTYFPHLYNVWRIQVK